MATGAAAPADAATVSSPRAAAFEAPTRIQPARRPRLRVAAAIAVALAAGAAIGVAVLDRGGDPVAAPTPTPTVAPGLPPSGRGLDVVGEPIRTVVRPNALAIADGNLWVSGYPSATQDRIDLSTRRVARARARAGRSSSAALGARGDWWLALSAQRKVVRLDGRTGRELRAVTFAALPSALSMLDGRLWVGLRTPYRGGPDYLVSIDPATGERGVIVPVPQGVAAVLAVDGVVWVANRRAATVTKYSVRDGAVLGRPITVGQGPQAMAYGAGHVWVANRRSNTVSRLDPDLDSGVATIPVGREPRGILVHRGVVYVANFTGSTITRLDARTGRRLGDPVPVGLNPYALAARGDTLWVGNVSDGTVSRLRITARGA